MISKYDRKTTWKTYKDGGEEIGSFTSIKRQNEQLKASLEEAHKELRKMQTGHSLEKVAVTSDVKELLHRTYKAEKRKYASFMKSYCLN